MFYAIQSGGKLDYNLKTYYAKDEADLNNINTNTCCPGSQAYTANGKLYTLNSNNEWIEAVKEGTGGSIPIVQEGTLIFNGTELVEEEVLIL